MTFGIEAKLIAAGVFVAALAAGLGLLHHRWYAAGVASQQSAITDLKTQRDLAKAQVAADANVLSEVNAAANRAKAEAATQAADAAAAQADAAKARAAQSKAEADFMSRLKAATSKRECAVLKEVLCDSVMGY